MTYSSNDLRNIASHIHSEGYMWEEEGKITEEEEELFLEAMDAIVKVAKVLERIEGK